MLEDGLDSPEAAAGEHSGVECGGTWLGLGAERKGNYQQWDQSGKASHRVGPRHFRYLRASCSSRSSPARSASRSSSRTYTASFGSPHLYPIASSAASVSLDLAASRRTRVAARSKPGSSRSGRWKSRGGRPAESSLVKARDIGEG